MHAPNVFTSDRISKLFFALKGAGGLGLTTLQIQQQTGSMAPGTDVSALRANGYIVSCAYEGRTASGAKLYRYVLHGRKAA